MWADLKKNAVLKFIVSSGVTYLFLYLIYQFIVRRNTYYDQKFIGTIINGSDFFLHLFGFNTFTVLQDLDFQVIGIDGSNGVWVGSNCNAISLFMLFVVFIIWYPGHQKSKLWFIPFGIITIHALNILRVMGLALIAKFAPNWLDFNHSYTFTFIVYAYIFVLWMWWVNKFAGKKTNAA
ncbi:MAG: archaeosortase/exosortase family protein [Bacteroidota bacterium]|nr:archaeosortase/exosortase family protein [Bacteroidota bacterium]